MGPGQTLAAERPFLGRKRRGYRIKPGSSILSQLPQPEPVWPSVRTVVLGGSCDRDFSNWKRLGRREEGYAKQAQGQRAEDVPATQRPHLWTSSGLWGGGWGIDGYQLLLCFPIPGGPHLLPVPKPELWALSLTPLFSSPQPSRAPSSQS